MWPFTPDIFHIHHHHYDYAVAEIGRIVRALEERIMAKLDDFVARVTEKLGTVATGLDGVQGDITALKATIEALKSSLGELTPEQETALAFVEKQVDELGLRVSSIDAQTPAE